MMAIDVEAMLAVGLAAHQAGRLAEAEDAYRRVLAAQPEQPEALHLLAAIAFQTGQIEDARALARQATVAAPAQPAFWNTLGVAERATGQLAEAVRCFTRAIDLDPAYVIGWTNLAATYELAGDRAAEADALATVTRLQPNDARAWGRRGILAYEAGQIAVACDCFAQMTALVPDDPDVWCNLGVAQLRLSRTTDAEVSLRRANALRPDSAVTMNNLGTALVVQARWDEAAALLERVVRMEPADPNGWVNLGHARRGQARHQDAYDTYAQALTLRPHDSPALVGLGDALQGLGDFTRAIDLYQQALAAQPDDPETYEHLGVAYQRLARLDEAAAALRRGLEIDTDRSTMHSALILVLDLKDGAEQEAIAERVRWNARFGKPASPKPVRYTNTLDPDRPLRVGYVSADFRHHSAAYAILPILRSHNHAQFTVVCYSGVLAPDHITAQSKTLVDVWHDTVYSSDDDLEALIRADEIDILVDLSGHSGGNRLPVFVRQPAPIQITAWGYAASTGMDAMQYFLADPIAIPPEDRHTYSEEIVSIPCVICYEPPPYAPAVTPLPALERGHITFGAFNRLAKVSPDTLATWGRVLAAVPTGHLILKANGADISPERERLLARLAVIGIPEERVTLLGSTPHDAHLAAHAEIDLMLDPFPQSGGITTGDALFMGVPTVTMLGQRVPGRVAASLLTTIGLSDLVARNFDEYVEIATRLAGNLERLTHERATLRARMLASPIGDAAYYTRAVEDVYRALWQRWCRERGGEGPGARDAEHEGTI